MNLSKIFEQRCPPELYGFLRLMTGVVVMTNILASAIFDPLKHSGIQFAVSLFLLFLCFSMVTGVFSRAAAIFLGIILLYLAHVPAWPGLLTPYFFTIGSSFGKPAYCAVLSYLCLILGLSPCDTTFRMGLRKKIKSDVAPAWPLYLMRFHVIAVYFWTAIAKIDTDFFSGVIFQQIFILNFVGSESSFQKFPPTIYLKIAVFLTIATELMLVVGLCYKKYRHLFICIGVAFHIVLNFVLPTVGFLLTMTVGLMSFLDPLTFPEKLNQFIGGKRPIK
jgi:hypothetical protein